MSSFTGAENVELRLYDDPSNPETSAYKVLLPITALENVVDRNTGQTLAEMIKDGLKITPEDFPQPPDNGRPYVLYRRPGEAHGKWIPLQNFIEPFNPDDFVGFEIRDGQLWFCYEDGITIIMPYSLQVDGSGDLIVTIAEGWQNPFSLDKNGNLIYTKGVS